VLILRGSVFEYGLSGQGWLMGFGAERFAPESGTDLYTNVDELVTKLPALKT
jgi:hypothetical protein